MSTYISNAGARGGNYDEAIGLDIDGEIVGTNLYDYDLLSRPSVSGSGIIIPGEVDSGFPTLSDYTETINPDGSKTRNLTSFLSENQKDSLDTMEDRVNNGRLGNVNIVSEEQFPENTDIIIKKDNRESSIKGILEENSLNSFFFGETKKGYFFITSFENLRFLLLPTMGGGYIIIFPSDPSPKIYEEIPNKIVLVLIQKMAVIQII